MKNPRTSPSGRTKLLGPAGAPIAQTPEQEPQEPAPVERQQSPRPWRHAVPLGHGKHVAELIEARRQLAEARRSGDNEGQRIAARRLREMSGG